MCAAEQSVLSWLPKSLLCMRFKAGCTVFILAQIVLLRIQNRKASLGVAETKVKQNFIWEKLQTAV